MLSLKNAIQNRIKLKKLLTILFVFLVVSSNAQSKKTIAALSNGRLLEQTIFETKDRSVLEGIFGKTISLMQSDGKMLAREEAIAGIVNNRSVYTNENSASAYDVSEAADSMIIKHVYKATEKKENGQEEIIAFFIESVWAKENSKWKLFRCKIVGL